MKVYTKETRYYYYPEDMEKILGYLAANGTIKVSAKEIEGFYHDFSQDVYGVGWKAPQTEIMEHFANWITIIDVE